MRRASSSTSHEGRPTKIEGNPDHPASLGATTIWAQADILDLYDPDRAQAVVKNGEISTWDNFLQELNLELVRQQSVAGAGLRFLTPVIQSPTLEAQIAFLLRKFPQAKWRSWDPLARDSLGNEPLYDFEQSARDRRTGFGFSVFASAPRSRMRVLLRPADA